MKSAMTTLQLPKEENTLAAGPSVGCFDEQDILVPALVNRTSPV
ncbi:hypothetical protein [Virgibacillus sp. JSM 102003]